MKNFNSFYIKYTLKIEDVNNIFHYNYEQIEEIAFILYNLFLTFSFKKYLTFRFISLFMIQNNIDERKTF